MPLVPTIPGTGGELRLWRREYGVTQVQVAQALGVSPSTISRWERSDATLSEAILDKFRLVEEGLLQFNLDEPPFHLHSIWQRIATDVLDFNQQWSRWAVELANRLFPPWPYLLDQARSHLIESALRAREGFRQESVERAAKALEQATWGVERAAKALEQATWGLERIREVLATQDAVTAQVYSELAKRGWFPGPGLMYAVILQIAHLLKLEDHQGIEDLMLAYTRERLNQIVEQAATRSPSRARILRSAAKAHEEGRYELTVPVLLAQADGIARDLLGGLLFKTRKKRPEVWQKAKERLQVLKNMLGEQLYEAVLAPIYSQTTISEYYSPDRQDERDPLYGPLNRHAVLHGFDCNYGTEGNSLRAFLLLDFVLSVESTLQEEENSPLSRLL